MKKVSEPKYPMKPIKPEPPWKPQPKVFKNNYIDVRDIIDSGENLSVVFERLKETLVLNNVTEHQVSFHIEVADDIGASDFYGDEYEVKLMYLVEEDNPYYYNQLKQYNKDMLAHKKKLEKYREQFATYKAELALYENFQKESKRNLYEQLKKEFGDA